MDFQKSILDHGYLKYVAHLGDDTFPIRAARQSTGGRGFVSWEPYVRCKVCGACWTAPGHAAGQAIYLTAEDREKACEHFCPVTEHEKFPRGDLGLLEFLYKNKHHTPFEMSELIVEAQAPIMVFREWHRHRTQSYNEMSGRYSVLPDLSYVPALERMQKQSTANKQGSAEPLSEGTAIGLRAGIESEQRGLRSGYEARLATGLAKEVARVNTPIAQYSRMWAKGNLRNWFAFLMLRKAPSAQWEIRQYADAIGELILQLWPRCYALFEEHDFYGKRLSRTEWAEIERKLAKYEAEEKARAYVASIP